MEPRVEFGLLQVAFIVGWWQLGLPPQQKPRLSGQGRPQPCHRGAKGSPRPGRRSENLVGLAVHGGTPGAVEAHPGCMIATAAAGIVSPASGRGEEYGGGCGVFLRWIPSLDDGWLGLGVGCGNWYTSLG